MGTLEGLTGAAVATVECMSGNLSLHPQSCTLTLAHDEGSEDKVKKMHDSCVVLGSCYDVLSEDVWRRRGGKSPMLGSRSEDWGAFIGVHSAFWRASVNRGENKCRQPAQQI